MKNKLENRKQKRDERGNAETPKPEKLKSEAARTATRQIASGGVNEPPAVAHSVKRGAFDRMKRIYGLLQDGEYLTARALVKRYEGKS